jgi:hypothetical protein
MFIDFILSDPASVILATAAFFLMVLYMIQLCLTVDQFVINKGVRKNRLLMRALNWGVFGMVFLLFGNVIEFQDLATWRATARVALLFLMFPELAYQITILWPTIKRGSWTKI